LVAVSRKGSAAERPGPHASPHRSVNAHRAVPDSAGPDIGWAIACGGLLLAAAVLGLTGDNRRASSPGTASPVELLRPLAGRR